LPEAIFSSRRAFAGKVVHTLLDPVQALVH
jgi:hypothetical protein